MSHVEIIKALREATGAGVVDIKKALDEAGGDQEKALDILRQAGKAKASKKSDRTTGEGVVVSYVHSNNRVGVLVKLYCETDFVARNEEFQELGRDIAMHIAAMNPEVIRPEEVSDETVSAERASWKEALLAEGKKEEMLEGIMAGKEKKFRGERALLTQPFVKNPDITVEELITEKIHKIGENIQVGEFCRFAL